MLRMSGAIPLLPLCLGTNLPFFFEGPRSRCYGHTAALRLIVQPCDEDDQFFRFSVKCSTGRMKLTGENRSTRGKLVPVPLCPPQIPHGPTRDGTRTSTVRDRRLTVWAMARPYLPLNKWKLVGAIVTRIQQRMSGGTRWHSTVRYLWNVSKFLPDYMTWHFLAFRWPCLWLLAALDLQVVLVTYPHISVKQPNICRNCAAISHLSVCLSLTKSTGLWSVQPRTSLETSRVIS
jgi:hypothetical protein